MAGRPRRLLRDNYRTCIIAIGEGTLSRLDQVAKVALNVNALETVSEEMSVQLETLPSPGEVSAVVSQLETDDLREFAVAVMNAAVHTARNGTADIEDIRLLNSWFASMEETVAAGDDLQEILSRRRATEASE